VRGATACGRLVLTVEILGDALGPPAAPVGGRPLIPRQQTAERKRDCFARLGIGLRSGDEVHVTEPKGARAS
jgi:hypothetical protein